MRNFQRHLFIVLAFVCCGAPGLWSASAGQQAPQKPAKSASDDDPVAISEKPKTEKKPEVREITDEQFGNFRFPTINNKGEIAFVGLFPDQRRKSGADQAVFVRKADGAWAVMRRGEKAANLAEPVSTLGPMPSFNDNGDFTFVGEFEGAPVPAAPAPDPLDPTGGQQNSMPPQNKSLFLRTAEGLKSLARLGQEVPNMPSRYTGFANPSTNSKGVTAFIATYGDPDGRGLFMIEQDKTRIIVRSGQRVGLGVEGSFSEHYYPTPINERSEVAFLGRIGDKAGIFVSRPSGLELIAMTEKPAPFKDTNFIGFGNRTPAINNKGEVVFAAFTNNTEAQRALFFKGEGPIKVVARSGDKIGDTGYAFSDFLSPAVNSRGDIAFIGLYGGRNRGMFIKTAKGIEPIAMLEQPVPGGAKDEVFNQFSQPSINDRGEVVFYAQMKGGNVGIFHRDEKGVLRTVARRGDKMPK